MHRCMACFVSVEIRRDACVCDCVQFYLVTDLQSQNGQKCLRVKARDRLGVYFEDDLSSLSYQFITEPSHVRVLAHHFQNASYPVADSNESVRFFSIIYPYDFLAAAYCYLGKLQSFYSFIHML